MGIKLARAKTFNDGLKDIAARLDRIADLLAAHIDAETRMFSEIVTRLDRLEKLVNPADDLSVTHFYDYAQRAVDHARAVRETANGHV